MCSTFAHSDESDTYQGLSSLLLDTIPLKSEKVSKRAERKALTQSQMKLLMGLNSERYDAYKRTLHCVGYLYAKQNTKTKEVKFTTNFCAQRWCTVCANNKTAELMANYRASLENLSDSYFVTLTVVSVKGHQLKDRITAMNNTFKQIKNLFHKRKIPFDGFRKVECNHNAEVDTFNPHYGIIVDGVEQANLLVEEWLKRNKGTERQAQDIRKVDENSYIELFKYQFKAITKGGEFSPQAQDTIYTAFKGIRAFRAFGNVHKSPVTSDVSIEESEYGVDDDKALQGEWVTIDVFVWNPYHYNWLNAKGEKACDVTIRDKIYAMESIYSSG